MSRLFVALVFVFFGALVHASEQEAKFGFSFNAEYLCLKEGKCTEPPSSEQFVIGATITEVVCGGPAYHAQVLKGDQIVAVNEYKLFHGMDPKKFRQMMDEALSHDLIVLTVIRVEGVRVYRGKVTLKEKDATGVCVGPDDV